ncbi:MAG: DEAD/DEAH box helicase [Cetobacterium sp.]
MIRIKREGNTILICFHYRIDFITKLRRLGATYLDNKHYWILDIKALDELVDEFKDVTIEGLEEVIKSLDKGIDYKERLRGIKPIINFTFKTKPFPHQIEGFNNILDRERLLLTDEQGLGKTKQAIDVGIARKQFYNVNKALIICGVNSTKYNWQNEIKVHSYEKSIVIDGTAKEKEERIIEWLDGNTFFGIINIESLRIDNIYTLLKKHCGKEINYIVVDEIHKAKNGTCKQGKALRTLQAKYMLGLTGTPLTNCLSDLWNILFWVGAYNKNFFVFRNRYLQLGNFKQVVGYKNVTELKGILNSVMLRRTKKMVLDLPPKVYKTEFLEMDNQSKRMYKQIQNNLIEELGDILLNPSPLSKLINLRKFTGGLMGCNYIKYDRLIELCEEYKESNKKVVVFSPYKSEITQAFHTLATEPYNIAMITGDTKTEDRQKIVNNFQDEKIDILLGTIGAMGTGLTLTKGSVVIFLSKAWTPADNKQAEDRCHRIGTNDTVEIITLICKSTIDEHIEELLSIKEDLFNDIVEGKINKKNMEQIIKNILEV